MADTYRRGSARNAVTVKLTHASAFTDFKRVLEANPPLRVDVLTTLDYFAKQSEAVTQMILATGIVVGVIIKNSVLSC